MEELKPIDKVETQKKVPDAILQRSFPLVVDIQPRTKLHARLQACRYLNWLFPKTKRFEVSPIYLGSLIKISKIIMGIPEELYVRDRPKQSHYNAIIQHGEAMAKIIALAIVNRPADPPARLVRFIMRNFSPREIAATMIVVVEKMEVMSFMSSIISVRGLNVLRMKETEMSLDQRS